MQPYRSADGAQRDGEEVRSPQSSSWLPPDSAQLSPKNASPLVSSDYLQTHITSLTAPHSTPAGTGLGRAYTKQRSGGTEATAFLEAENGRSEAPRPTSGAARPSGAGASTGLYHPSCGPHEFQPTEGSASTHTLGQQHPLWSPLFLPLLWARRSILVMSDLVPTTLFPAPSSLPSSWCGHETLFGQTERNTKSVGGGVLRVPVPLLDKGAGADPWTSAMGALSSHAPAPSPQV